MREISSGFDRWVKKVSVSMRDFCIQNVDNSISSKMKVHPKSRNIHGQLEAPGINGIIAHEHILPALQGCELFLTNVYQTSRTIHGGDPPM